MSPAHRFHPEFGYFCPTPNFRRKMRTALACMVFAAITVAIGTLVRRAAHDQAADTALTLTRGEASSAAGGTSPTRTGEMSRPPEGRKASCEQEAWAYLDGKCVAGRARKSRSLRPGNGTQAFGAVDPARQTLQQAGEALAPLSTLQDAAPAAAPKPARALDAAASSPATEPVAHSQSAPPRKKAQKRVRRNTGPHRYPDEHSVREHGGRTDHLRGRVYTEHREHWRRSPFGFLFW
jgi:hypothetical protein